MFMINKSNSTIYGIIFMLINTMALAGLDISAKTLRGTIDAPLIVFMYKFSLFLIILPWVCMEGILRLKTKKAHLHMLRSLLSVAGSFSFIHGLGLVNMSDAAALENIQYVLVAIVGMIFFKERCTKIKIAAIIIGFAGAVIVVKPDIFNSLSNTSFNKDYWFIILAICFWSLNTILVKLLGNTEHNKTQMFYLLLFASIFSFLGAFINYKSLQIMGLPLKIIPISFRQFGPLEIGIKSLLLLATMASCYFIHGVAYFNALKSELSIVIPFRYTKLLFSGILGYTIFAEIVSNHFSYVGYALIIASGLLLFSTQVRKKKEEIQTSVDNNDAAVNIGITRKKLLNILQS